MRLEVNGSSFEVHAERTTKLLGVLRGELGLTGSKYGCGEGKCGACMVLVDGQARPSCQLSVGDVEGSRILTIEGLSADGSLHPVQQAFIDEGAMQCGYCTPGMIMGAVGLLAQNPDPTVAEIAEGMNRHICRCGTYARILRAIRRAAGATAKKEAAEVTA